LKNTSDLNARGQEALSEHLRERFSKSVPPKLLARISNAELLEKYGEHKHAMLQSLRDRSEGVIENSEGMAGNSEFISWR